MGEPLPTTPPTTPPTMMTRKAEVERDVAYAIASKK
jgi:hypothetical protein